MLPDRGGRSLLTSMYPCTATMEMAPLIIGTRSLLRAAGLLYSQVACSSMEASRGGLPWGGIRFTVFPPMLTGVNPGTMFGLEADASTPVAAAGGGTSDRRDLARRWESLIPGGTEGSL